MYFTYGLLNIIILTKVKKRAEELVKWIESKDITWECWQIKNKHVIKQDHNTKYNNHSTLKLDFINSRHSNVVPELESSYHEYCDLMLIVLIRASEILPNIVKTFLLVDTYINSDVMAKVDGSDDKSIYIALGILTIINAGLSRFISQTLSGMSPIAKDGCYYWSHSLLGIGIANLAINNIREFIQNTVGNLRIPQIIDALQFTNTIYDNIWDEDTFIKKDNLVEFNKMLESKISKEYHDLFKEDLIPLIAYFSGRDGFKAYNNTITAPIESVFACNTKKWGLITITHEISHTIIRGVLSIIYPDTKAKLDDSIRLLKRMPRNTLEELQYILIKDIIDLELTDEDNDNDIKLDKEVYYQIFNKNRKEIEELMVHTFDYLYFYSDNRKYLKGIWTTWSVIPNIKDRVLEYIVRSICAIMSEKLTEASPEVQCKNILLEVLKDLKSHNTTTQYIDEAIEYLRKDWDTISSLVTHRKPIISFVKAFLYSEEYHAKVYKEKYTSTITSNKGRYKAKINEIDNIPFSNPIRFMNKYCTENKPSSSKSLWVLYNLAFNYEARN
jgi:hypothetical protein